MTSVFKSLWWKAKVPKGWDADEDDVCVTFKPGGSAAAIQVSAAVKETAPVTDDDLIEFADQRILNRQVKPIKLTKFEGIHVEYLLDDMFWREWWLRSDNLMLYVTYNTQKKLKDADRIAIDDFISSIEPLSSDC